MPKNWAEVSLDTLQTDIRVGEDYTGDIKIQLEGSSNFCKFTLLGFLISSFLNGSRDLPYLATYHVYLQCLEHIKYQPQTRKGKGKLAYHISQIGLESILMCEKTFVNYLRTVDRHLERILFSPRSLNSKHLKKYENISFRIVFREVNKTRGISPVRHIGVGYRDKGHCTKIEHNGTPSWQEVANARLEEPIKKIVRPERDEHLKLIISDSWLDLRKKSVRRFKKKRRQEFSPLY